MKSILQSIKPQYCELIASSEVSIQNNDKKVKIW